MPTTRDVLNTIYMGMAPVGDHTSTSSVSTATEITIPAGANRIMMQAATKSVRVTFDGTTPTTTVGFLLTAGNDPLIFPVQGCTLTAIEIAATAVLNYQFFE